MKYHLITIAIIVAIVVILCLAIIFQKAALIVAAVLFVGALATIVYGMIYSMVRPDDLYCQYR